MRRAALVLAVMAACGRDQTGGRCEPAPWSSASFAAGTSVDGSDLAVVGVIPGRLDAVLRAAQDHCGRPIVGRLLLPPYVLSPKFVDGQSVVQGRACPLDAWAMFKNNGLDATAIPIAHEIGHWCLQTSDEGAAETWANVVNGEALGR